MSIFFLRYVVIQAVLAAGLIALWLSGYLIKPFEGDSRWFSIIVLALGSIGIILVGLKRFADAAWLDTIYSPKITVTETKNAAI